MALLIGFICVAAASVALVFGVGAVLDFFSSGRKEVKGSQKAALVLRTKQLAEAKTALIKIAANESGHPTLDASLALENIQRLELTELEN